MVASALVFPAVLGLGSLYRHGNWSLGPSAPSERDACAESGGREGDLFLIHHCAPNPLHRPYAPSPSSIGN
jgi:hypothetical protein